jgi:hypothetical protein
MRSLDLCLMLRLFSPVNTICARRGLPVRDQAQLALIQELFEEGTARKTVAYGTKKGGVCESVAGPGTAGEIVEWSIHWGTSFISFQNRSLKYRFDDWLDEIKERIKDMRQTPVGSE